MMINERKRAAHRRRVQETLTQILNDPAVMPNADCPDRVVSVSRVVFGRTVAEVFVEIHERWRRPRDQWMDDPHDKYMREARERGERTYIELDEVFFFPWIAEVVSIELQKQLGLLYAPDIRLVREIGKPRRVWPLGAASPPRPDVS